MRGEKARGKFERCARKFRFRVRMVLLHVVKIGLNADEDSVIIMVGRKECIRKGKQKRLDELKERIAGCRKQVRICWHQ